MRQQIDAPEFTDEQIRAALKQVGRDARRGAFAAGCPVYFVRGHLVVALHADGTEDIVGRMPSDTDDGVGK